jgi:ankyrin repeat protein
MHFAVMQDDDHIITAFLECHPSIHLVNNNGETPLNLASEALCLRLREEGKGESEAEVSEKAE